MKSLYHFLTIGVVLFTFVQTALAADAAKGAEVYKTYCASCHGDTGAGDGPTGAALPPNMKPADLTKAAFKKVTDDAQMAEIIKKGGAAFGLSPLMAPQTALSDEDIANVVAYVRTLKK